MIDSVAGSIIAAPTPSSSDSPMNSWTTFCDSEAISEPTANSVAPMKNSLRRPMMSPSRPKLISSEANTSE